MSERVVLSDEPRDLQRLRARLNAETCGDYATFKKGLVADYGKVRRDIAGGYLALAAIACSVGPTATGPLALATVVLGAIAIGFVIAYLQLFIHEAAHHSLASDPRTNDRMADSLICWQVGTDIRSYRATHWEHHRSLGQPNDTEVSYRNRLNLGFIVAMLTGVHAIRVFLTRKASPRAASARSLSPLARGIAVHVIILLGLAAVGWWGAVLAWIGGVGIFYPFFATLRQLLEHRPGARESGKSVVTRLFGDSIFDRCFGGAGFNRHFLHHLEPQISYTRLGDLEAYLMNTTAESELEARRTSYGRAFADLLRSDRA